MKKVELQIYDRESSSYVAADIDKSTEFSYVLSQVDLENPTISKIGYTRSISLPKTGRNNRLFSNMWKFDSMVYNFNPLLRTSFRLYIQDNLYQSGYMEMEDVTDTWNIRLYGGLGDFFYTMSELKLKDMEWNGKFSHVINRQLISNAWNNYRYNNVNGEDMREFFSYAMTYQGEYDNFSSDYVIARNGERKEVTWIDPVDNIEYGNPTLNEHKRNFRQNGTTSGTIFRGEYRSYYQRPMIRVRTILDKIFSDMREKGWKTELDQTFFNEKNPYYNDLWMICPQYSVSDSPITEYGNFVESGSSLFSITGRTTTDYHQLPFVRNNAGTTNVGSIGSGVINFPPSVAQYQNSSLYVKIRVPFRIKCIDDTGGNKNKNYYFTSSASKKQSKKLTLYMRSQVVTGSGSSITFTNPDTGEEFFDFRRDTVDGFNPATQEYLRVINTAYEGKKGDTKKGGDSTIFYMEANIPYTGTGSLTRNIQAALQYRNNNHATTGLYTGGGTFRRFHFEFELVSQLDSIEVFAPQELRSGYTVQWSDIMNLDHTYSDFLLSYGRIFGLIYSKSEYNKVVTIQTRNTFFTGLEKVDWTHKLDYSKEVSTVPLGFDYRVGIFKYQDSDTKYEEDYLTRTAREYGSFRFNNNYYYTDEEEDYLDGQIFYNGIVAPGYSQYYKGRHSEFPLKDDKELLFFEDNSESKVDVNLVLIFRNGFARVNQPFVITDDNALMQAEGYCWNSLSADGITCYSYPKLSRFFEYTEQATGTVTVHSLNFGRPSIAYSDDEIDYISTGDEGSGYETIYFKFWRKYLMDRFDINAKVLTAYFNITLNDIQSELFSKFIYINDTVWLIDKIVDFNPLNESPTKVELIRVQDPENYAGQQYVEGEFKLYYPDSSTELIVDGNIGTIRTDKEEKNLTLTVDSTLPWRIIDNDSITVSPLSGNPGRTTVNMTVPENTSEEELFYYVTFQWGTNTTTVELIQSNLGKSKTIIVSVRAAFSTLNGISGRTSFSYKDVEYSKYNNVTNDCTNTFVLPSYNVGDTIMVTGFGVTAATYNTVSLVLDDSDIQELRILITPHFVTRMERTTLTCLLGWGGIPCYVQYKTSAYLTDSTGVAVITADQYDTCEGLILKAYSNDGMWYGTQVCSSGQTMIGINLYPKRQD